MKLLKNPIFIIVSILCSSCAVEAEYVPIDERLDALPGKPGVPLDNEITEARVTLGKNLFWDPILSGDQTVSCATCHHPDKGYADGRALSSGIGGKGLGESRTGGMLVKRNSPTILNTAFNGIENNTPYDPTTAPMFWDNRASSLESQAKLPILSLEEMRGHGFEKDIIIDTILQRIQKIPTYVAQFESAYGTNGITEMNLFKAIATFERTLIANNSRFDQYVNGNSDALSDLEIRGLQAFIDSKCTNCHSGPMFSDYELHSLGVADHSDLKESDDGGDGQYRFRTPTLRNLSITGPYMHNGTKRTLEEVMEFYEALGEGEIENPNVNGDMLSEDLADMEVDEEQFESIIAFMLSLNDDHFDKSIPKSVPSGLPVGGDIK
ncbi:cytochrome-c peroxidase [Aquimarina sp. TRL1]|uniref:cytochrome-c peroxidase n=1 Tax=Aquimarina sp. (strain TRL1) TaxID=2736252 RepID=UPI00158CE7D6|nr:cytochrome c peroxidase [Aquimarina sp. TRL1]QKX03992.1 cytochrome-c peroxidase [Aquimarina sp. TRL1]